MTTTTETKRKRGAAPKRRQEIVAIGMELFAQKGVQATSVRDIADRAGILSGSLYSHFGSKDDILELGMRPYAEITLPELQEIAARDIPIQEKIDAMLRQSFSRMMEWRDAAIVMHGDWEYISAIEDFAFLREFYEGANTEWLRVLKEAVDSGLLASDVDPQVVLRMLTEIMGGTVSRHHPGSRYSTDVMADYFGRMLFGGLSTPVEARTASR